MKRGQPWLSRSVEMLARQAETEGKPPQFDAVVVGSGYGGAVAAARLSELAERDGKPAMSVCVLERGLEYTPGSFPASLAELVGHQRVSGAAALGGQTLAEGLMDWHIGGDVWALVGNGLGGGSLINAGVCAPAHASVLDREAWPEPWRGNADRWKTLYERASKALGATRWPAGKVPKQQAMENLARHTGGHCEPVSLTIQPPGSAPVPGSATTAPLNACESCGDCFTGCNVGAKRTLSHSYLGQAYRQGARLYTGATVLSVAPLEAGRSDGMRWVLRYVLTDTQLLPARVRPFEVHARHVVLAAGTFGSTEILMRSSNDAFQLSGRLGEGFSANGDILAAFYDTGEAVRLSPLETDALLSRKVGPTITSQITWPASGIGQAPDVMQDLGVPGALGWLYRELLTTMIVPQRWTRCDLRTQRPENRDVFAVDEGGVGRTLLTVSYADDGALGRLEPNPGWGGALHDGSLVVRWDKPAREPWFVAADERLARRAPADSFLLRNPLTQFMPKANYLGIGQTSSRLLSVHPLGGCRMGKDATKGVVDPYGRVYDAGIDLTDRGDPRTESLRERHDQRVAHAIHAGLYVLDGAIVPTALGINPLLTITALAEGAIDQWALDLGWVRAAPPAVAFPVMVTKPPHVAEGSTTAVCFSERMTGRIKPWQTVPDPAAPYRLSMRVRFEQVPDLQDFLQQKVKEVRLEAHFLLGIEQPPGPDGLPSNDLPLGAGERRLTGRVRWMSVEPSCVGQRLWRSYRTWSKTRKAADDAEDEAARRAGRPSTRRPLRELLSAGTHFGAVRLLDYEFDALDTDWRLATADQGYGELCLPAGTVLFGAKRVGYLQTEAGNQESTNPWYQLTRLPLKFRPSSNPARGPTQCTELGLLEFDEMAMLDRYNMPLAITAQSNMLTGMRDISSLALYFGRTMFGLHMLNFRRASYPAEEYGRRELRRLPPVAYDPAGAYGQIELTPFDVPLELKPGGELIHLRVTRLRLKGAASQGEPVLMLHGFGSGGVQFTHPAIEHPMAPWLATRLAREVWVGELRTSIGLPTANRQWVMDDVAKQDVPALVRFVRVKSGAPQVQLVAHCIGAAMFSMAVLDGRLQEQGRSLISSAVLMQVGPQVVLPRISRARGYVALRLQQIFGLDKASSVASQAPDDAESMMDRVLSSYLYREDQRPFYRLGSDHRRNVQRTNANRSAGIFGQLFQYQNMSSEVLSVMEDLLGDCNLSTYAQTALYAFGERLTDQRGDDGYVTDARMNAFFTFPVLFLHGAENQTFERKTHALNLKLAQRTRSLQGRFAGALIPGFGHLDCVVGKNAHAAVFGAVARHLQTTWPPAPEPPVQPPAPAAVRLPAIGPWIGHVMPAAEGQGLRLRVGMRLDDLGQGLQTVQAAIEPLCPPLNLLPPGYMFRKPECIGEFDISAQALQPLLSPQAQPTDRLEVLIAAAHGATFTCTEDFRTSVMAKTRSLVESARRSGKPLAAINGLLLDRHWLQRLCDAAPTDLGLVLGACRQRPLLVDREMADRSMAKIHALLDADRQPGQLGAHAPIDALLLVGDQIYADSRADSTHPGTSAGRFFDAYREAWTASWQREVMRRRPIYMVTDDHEFRNDFNNAVAAGRPVEFAAAREAWRAYQIDAGPTPVLAGDPMSDWRTLELRGFAVFLADTRSERQDSTDIARSGASIMSAAQMEALKAWLCKQQTSPGYGKRAKVIVSASPVVPFYGDPTQPVSELESDGWQRFPDSAAELLGWIADQQIDNVLFLSGDYHRHVRCTLQLQAGNAAPVTVTSIVTGGLYAPYPFANAEPDEWLQTQGGALQRQGQATVHWHYEITSEAGGDGFTRLTLDQQGSIRCDWVPVAPVAPSPRSPPFPEIRR